MATIRQDSASYGKAEQGVSCRFVRGCLGMPLTVEDGGVSEDMPGIAEDLVGDLRGRSHDGSE